MTGLSGTEGGHHALLECDTLILLGCDFAWRQFHPSKATFMQIDVDGTHAARRQTRVHVPREEMNGSATMNIRLHRQVMRELAAHGGKVPADLKD